MSRRPDLDGLGAHPRRPPADGRHGRTADVARLRQRDHAGRRTWCSASATAGPTGTRVGLDVHRAGRKFIHVDIEPTQLGRVFAPDLRCRLGRSRGASESCSRWRGSGPRTAGWRISSSGQRSAVSGERTLQRQYGFRRGADEAAAGLPGDEPCLRAETCGTSPRSGCRRSRPPRCCTSTGPGTGSTPGRPGRSGWTVPAALGVAVADPDSHRGGAVG